MNYSIKPLKCNLECQYCYEREFDRNKEFDINKVIDFLKKLFENKKLKPQNPPTLHGGEPLCLPIKHIEKIFSIIFEEYKYTGIQTNATLINDEHIELFKKYKTNAGISIDGIHQKDNQFRNIDDFLNNKILENIEILKQNDIDISFILMLHKQNAIWRDEKEKRGLFYTLNFMKKYARHIRLNLLIDDKYELDSLSIIRIYKKIIESEVLKNTFWQPHHDISDLLCGIRSATCNFRQCDPYNTDSEIPIFGNGQPGCCMKTYDDSFIYLRSEYSDFRYKILNQIEYDDGGCKGCKFWHICYGGCPAAAINNDWRNKSRFCMVYKWFFSHMYRKIKMMFPNIYLAPDFFPDTPQKSFLFIDKSVWRAQDKMNLPEKTRKLKQESLRWQSIDGHDDSNDPAWIALNPDWKDKLKCNC